jgi:hypothetical protein
MKSIELIVLLLPLVLANILPENTLQKRGRLGSGFGAIDNIKNIDINGIDDAAKHVRNIDEAGAATGIKGIGRIDEAGAPIHSGSTGNSHVRQHPPEAPRGTKPPEANLGTKFEPPLTAQPVRTRTWQKSISDPEHLKKVDLDKTHKKPKPVDESSQNFGLCRRAGNDCPPNPDADNLQSKLTAEDALSKEEIKERKKQDKFRKQQGGWKNKGKGDQSKLDAELKAKAKAKADAEAEAARKKRELRNDIDSNGYSEAHLTDFQNELSNNPENFLIPALKKQTQKTADNTRKKAENAANAGNKKKKNAENAGNAGNKKNKHDANNQKQNDQPDANNQKQKKQKLQIVTAIIDRRNPDGKFKKVNDYRAVKEKKTTNDWYQCRNSKYHVSLVENMVSRGHYTADVLFQSGKLFKYDHCHEGNFQHFDTKRTNVNNGIEDDFSTSAFFRVYDADDATAPIDGAIEIAEAVYDGQTYEVKKKKYYFCGLATHEEKKGGQGGGQGGGKTAGTKGGEVKTNVYYEC